MELRQARTEAIQEAFESIIGEASISIPGKKCFQYCMRNNVAHHAKSLVKFRLFSRNI